jgi:glycosyltransferase involved in cell wall biosynthesis
MPKTKLSILIPVRNEGINIKIMLKFLRAVVDVPCEILVVHDSLDDETVPVVKSMQDEHPHVKLVHNDLGKGVVNAIKAGIKASEGEIVLIFAADEVGPVIAINDMISLIDEGCDLVSCTRYAYGGRRLGGSLIGGFLSRIANKMFCALSGSVFTDATTGIKMFRKKIFDRITLEAEPVGWAVVFELAIKAQIEGMKLGEVPIISIDRLYGGKSTFSLGPWVREYFKWFLWGVRNLHLLKSEKPVVKKCLYR